MWTCPFSSGMRAEVCSLPGEFSKKVVHSCTALKYMEICQKSAKILENVNFSPTFQHKQSL